MGFSFGYVTEIDSEVALGSFIMMIAFLVGFDHLTGVLEWSLQGVPIYNHMLQHIYKEIMIMGVVSFCIGMYNTTDEAHRQANQEWIIGIDFAHYILFYMAFFFVLHAFYLIFLAMETAKQFDKFHSMTIANVRALVPPDYSWFNELIFNYSPVSKVRDSFEFKIVHVLFRDTYKWVALDFNFSSYLSGCMQHYALKVMSAGSSSWLVILVLIVLNYARIKLGGDGYLNCGPDKYDQSVIYINATDDDHHRMLIQKEADMFSGYSEDEEEHLNRILAGGAAEVQSVSTQCSIRVLRAFFMCGVMLCCLTILFLAVSRIYMSRLIHRTGCDSPADYFNFLSLEEETLNEELMENRRRTASIGDGDTPSMDNGTSTFRLAEIKQQRLSGTNAARKGGGRRMSIGSAARSINELKKKTVSEEVEMYMKISNGFVSCRRGMRRGIDCIIDWFHACWMYIFHREAYNRMVEKVNALKGPEKLSLSLKGGPVLRMLKSPDSMNGVSPEPSIAEMQQQVEPKSPRKSMFKPRVTVFPLVSDQQSTSTINKFRLRKIASGNAIGSISTRSLVVGRHKATVQPHGETAESVKSSQDFSGIYLWQKPKLFFTSIEILFSLNCFYLAMWVTNFITLVDETLHNRVTWQIIMLLPVLFIMPCLGQIVKTASLLSAISELDLNVMAHVLEDTQDRLNLLKVLRERILERIDHSDAKNNTPDLVVSNLFAVIDTDDSGELSKKEFGLFFALLDLNYSDEKFNHLFHTIDINKDGSISKQELCNMVFAGLNGGVFVKTTENVTADKADDVEALLKSSAELSLGYNEDESRWLSKHNIVGTGLIIPPSDPTVRKSFTSRQMSSREMNSDQSDDEDSGAKHAVRAATTVSADEIPKRRDSFDNQIEALEDIL